ncbi:MAG: isopentenyl phosphate kinase [Anaerolineaceae bacterium]
MKPELIFLKLGGSLITDKDRPHTARRRLIRRLALEIKQALAERPEISIILGHGSGSFAHIPAARHGTRRGVSSKEEWMGFLEVWQAARALNQIVIEECLNAGLPVIAFPPSATHISTGRQGRNSSLPIIQSALNAGLIPVVYGDVVFDKKLGGTIFSTEEVFNLLVEDIKPARILLAGFENGVYQDFPRRRNVIGTITPESYKMDQSAAGASASIDVTGGMYKKVNLMVQLVSLHPELSVQVFSGRRPGVLKLAISGERPGTTICSTF